MSEITQKHNGKEESNFNGQKTYSITMLIHKICIALSGFGSPKHVAMVSMVNAAKDVDSWKERKLRML